ncbi:NAD(P)-dependent oxidoreductase, partial [Rhizobiaceae sp. 2RAB30]
RMSRPPSDMAPARIRPLSVLPVFLDLQGKRAVVAGGTDGTAWKAELLAAAGADVHVYALPGRVSGEMRRVIDRERAVVLHEWAWDAACLESAAVALADAEDDEEAARFEAAARAAGAACNVIDKPVYCHFQFGSIVNRSPVVVGISTSAAAPILGQAIRRRIEAVLPPALADWAALARRLRDQVATRLAPGPCRRAFWEKLVDRAFGPAPTADAEAVFNVAMVDGSADGEAGQVTVVTVTADAELLTLRSIRLLQAADVILFDDLVPDAVLELARREAGRIPVGRHAGAGSRSSEIARIMSHLAREGRRVVLLRYDDQRVVGGIAEETKALGMHRHQVPFSRLSSAPAYPEVVQSNNLSI